MQLCSVSFEFAGYVAGLHSGCAGPGAAVDERCCCITLTAVDASLVRVCKVAAYRVLVTISLKGLFLYQSDNP
jgi:hypothetical protein